MNALSMFSRVALVVSFIVCVNNVNADDNGSVKTLSQILNQGLNFAVTTTHDSKFIIAGTFLADHAEESIIGKAAVETAGYAFDLSKGDLSKIDPEEVGKHFIINYGVRRAGDVLSKRGYTLDPLINSLDQLPAGVGGVVSPVITPLIQTATHPEMITLALLYTWNNFVIPYVQSNKK